MSVPHDGPPICLVCGAALTPAFTCFGWCSGCAEQALKDILDMRDLEKGHRVIMAELLRYAHARFIAGVISSS